MFFHQRFIPGLAIASYLIGDEKSKRCAVIDPTRDVDEYIAIAAKEKLKITDILETHVHADFVSGARELKAKLNGAPTIHCSGMGGADWTPAYADHVVQNGDEVTLGSIRLRAMHTPGHTPEHVSWQLFDDTRSRETPWLILTGDFVFVGDVGRPDLLGEKERTQLAHQLYESVFQRIAGLPDFVEVFPSHGAGSLCGKAIGSRRSSSLGFERQFNASMKKQSEPQWTETLLRGMPPAPPYFKRMKRINKEGPAILGENWPGKNAIAPRDLQAMNDADVLDVRREDDFAASHIPRSINIALSGQLPTWAGWVLPEDKPIVIVVSDHAAAQEAVLQLLRVGFDRVAGYLLFDSWKNEKLPIKKLSLLTAQQLATKLDSSNPPVLIDVRTDGEWQSGHIDSAKHIQAGMVMQHLNELPRDAEVAVICGSGFRSSMAASMLQREGYKNVASVTGGMSAWDKLKASPVGG